MTTLHLLVGFLCFGALFGESLAQVNNPSIHHLIIWENKVKVCFSKGDTDNTYNYFLLDIEYLYDDNSDGKPISLKKPSQAALLSDNLICIECTEANCITDEDMSYFEGKAATFVLHIEKDGNDGDDNPLLAIGTTTMPATLPVPAIGDDHDVYVIGNTNEKIIKVPEEIIDTGNTLFLNDEKFEVASCLENYPCYLLKNVEATKSSDVEFMVCYQKTPGTDIPVCGNPKQGIVITKKVDPAIPITVDYDANKVSFELPTTYTEVLQTTPLAICFPSSSSPCPLPGANSEYEVILVDYTNKEFQIDMVKDRALKVYELGPSSSTVEVTWTKITEKYFKMIRKTTTTETDDTYHNANVDCSATQGDNCHAYFMGLPVGSHVITIQHITEANWATKVPEKDLWKKSSDTTIVSHVQQLPGLNEGFQVIHVENIATTVTEDMILLDVCFEYIPDIIRNNTQYEFLAVNTKGKWKKENGDKKKDDLHACFHGIQLPLADFSESSKFFVLLRDSDNGKPLASGEVTFDLPAVRAIKPEVDNGNNGSTSTLTIVGAAIAGIACLMALVAAAVMFVRKINRNNDGLQYPLRHNNIEDSSTIHGLDNSIPTM